MVTTAVPPPTAPMDLSGNPRRHHKERAMRAIFFAAAAMSVVISALIVGSLFVKGWDFLTQADWGGVFGDETWNPRQDIFGIRPLLVSSVIVTGIAMLVAVPLGLGAAVYLSEYARPRIRSMLKPILEVLAGVPSVVLGFFALGWIAPNVIGTLFGAEHGRGGSMAAAGIGVGILAIPLVASVSEDAMRAVPTSLREASAGLGARRMATTVRVVIPAAVSGLVAAFILAVSRALGETMVVFIAAGAAAVGQYSTNPLDSGLTMTAAMASLATGTDQVRGADLAYPSLFMVGIVLFVFTLVLNIVGNRFVRRVRQAY
ncbi:MAG TPA: phosphate ABC transporter permease subunit PstC [Acidimicrobiales bacterium]|nr:phosphate ABC transporter permease subunit PstC [Acidimicrobiales bacterium]